MHGFDNQQEANWGARVNTEWRQAFVERLPVLGNATATREVGRVPDDWREQGLVIGKPAVGFSLKALVTS